MHARQPTHLKIDHGERGAAAVEFALVAVLLCVLLFGIIEFGMGFNNYQSLRQGVRDGTREAVVGQFGSVTSCGIAGAATANTETQKLICHTKDAVGLGNSTRVKVLLTDTSYAKGNRIVVCAQHELSSITGLFNTLLDNKQLKTRVQMRIEKDATGTAPNAAEETAPSGGGWSWCTTA